MLWFVVLGSIVLSTAGAQKIPLPFSYITSKTGSFVTAGAIPMVDLALELINNRTDILANYTLTYNNTIGDSNCDRTPSLNEFMDRFRGVSSPTYISLLCCGCASSTIAVAELSHYWNIPQIAGVAAAHELNDRSRFKAFFSTDATTEYIGPALLKLAQEFKWKQAAIITQGESPFTLITVSISAAFKSDQRLLDTSAVFQKTDNPIHYNQLFNWNIDFRVVIINANDLYIYEILCEAYHRNMQPPKYVWITPGWYGRQWWARDFGNTSCSVETIEGMLVHSLTFNPSGNLVSDDTDVVTFSGLTPGQYTTEYARRLQLDHYKHLMPITISGSVFDATWSMALGLQLTLESVAQKNSSGCDHLPGELVPLEQFDYKNQRMGCVMRRSYSSVSFRGITGDVLFNSNGSRDIKTVRIQQIRMSEADVGAVILFTVTVMDVLVGENSGSSKIIFRGNNSLSAIWPNGIPYDGSAREILHPNHLALIITYSLLAVAGLVYAGVCLLFNTIFRNNKVVKLSSPNLNVLLVAGAALLYMSVFFYLFTPSSNDQTGALVQTILCNLQQWLSSTGYTLCLAVILSKTWRIYYIFAFHLGSKSRVPRVPYTKDRFLFLIVAALVSVNTVILFLGTAIPQSRFNATLASDLQHPTAIINGINYNYNVYVCLNSGTVVWLAFLYIYKGLLQLAAMFMAFHIRKVNIKAFNDSLEIAICVYLNCVTLLLLAVVEFTLSAYHEAYAAMFGAGLMVGATLFLTLVFTPRVVHLYKDPHGTSVINR